jgi:hypothetical protein
MKHMTNTQTEKPLHAFSGQRSDAAFTCGECFTPMTGDGGVDWTHRSCAHSKVGQFNPIINWRNTNDWLDAVRHRYDLGDCRSTHEVVLLSQLLTNEIRTHSGLQKVLDSQIERTGSCVLTALPQNVLRFDRLLLLAESSYQKIKMLEGAIKFGVNA